MKIFRKIRNSFSPNKGEVDITAKMIDANVILVKKWRGAEIDLVELDRYFRKR